jgi:SAM-dependent methyltransferase
MLTLRRVGNALRKRASQTELDFKHRLSSRRDFKCSACGEPTAGFFRYGPDPNWGCPMCGASPRERLVNVLIDGGVLNIATSSRILQVAPTEKSLVARFSKYDLTLADLHPEVYLPIQVQNLDLMHFGEHAGFDLIYLSHVMEHVPDDIRVLHNIHGALKPGGEVWIIVPMGTGPTEDGDLDMPASERERRFGQWDHLRLYGRDIAARIKGAGLSVREVGAADCSPEVRLRTALSDGDVVFVGKKS